MIEVLFIKGTDDTPEFNFNSQEGKFLISGNSFSDDPFNTFKPVFDWIDLYAKSPNPETLVEFKINYMNTSSSKQINELLMRFKKISDKTKLKIHWYYDRMDEDMKYDGETLKSIVELDFDLIEQ
jgi:hypothetical protein